MPTTHGSSWCPSAPASSELFELEAAEQQQLWQETTLLAEALKASYGADKMNVATLGNVVSQLHMHVIVRQRDDAAWPAPVWGKCPAVAYRDDQLQAIRQRVRGLQLAGYPGGLTCRWNCESSNWKPARRSRMTPCRR